MDAPVECLPDGRLVLDQPVSLPDVLDVLIVGGGPAGTAAAFAAKERGLSALVIEHDDILKRICDYAKGKPIKPDFGGAKQMGFPKGGDLIAQLHFSDIDKDEMFRQWKHLYCRNSVSAMIGVELTGLERLAGPLWHATTWNRNTESEQVFRARHVVLALGAGMPRRLDIPGNTQSIALCLADPVAYVGGPACVIGGGTSAAEAVIAISSAKLAASDPSAIYWSHRGEKMPTVSAALAHELFEAMHVRGNVRYLLHSETVGVITREGEGDSLRIETDRRMLPDRPIETTQLEFQTKLCVACIGQEIPATFLNSLGIYAVTGGPRNKNGFVLNPLLETRHPNVYLVGDTLNTSYLECTDFDGDPSTFVEKKHRGNVKTSLRDGVLVAEAIAQKLARVTEIHVEIESVYPGEPDAPPPPPVVARPAVQAPSEKPDATLVRLLQEGVEAEEFMLRPVGVTTIGREGCDIAFTEDSMLAQRHASLTRTNEGYELRDENSTTRVFLYLTGERPREISPGAIVRVGTQWLVFARAGDPAGFVHYDPRGREVGRHALSADTVVVGRAAPDITLSPNDMSLSRRHASIVLRDGKTFLRDLKSANGTHVKVEHSIVLRDGDQIRMGHQTLRFAMLEQPELVTSVRHVPAPALPPPTATHAGATAAPLAETAAPSGTEILFRTAGKTCPFKSGQSICEVAEANGVEITADCHRGICGSDAIRIVSGAENVNAISAEERETLEDICGVDPDQHRLACVSRPTGPVVVDIVVQ